MLKWFQDKSSIREFKPLLVHRTCNIKLSHNHKINAQNIREISDDTKPEKSSIKSTHTCTCAIISPEIKSIFEIISSPVMAESSTVRDFMWAGQEYFQIGVWVFVWQHEIVLSVLAVTSKDASRLNERQWTQCRWLSYLTWVSVLRSYFITHPSSIPKYTVSLSTGQHIIPEISRPAVGISSLLITSPVWILQFIWCN